MITVYNFELPFFLIINHSCILSKLKYVPGAHFSIAKNLISYSCNKKYCLNLKFICSRMAKEDCKKHLVTNLGTNHVQ